MGTREGTEITERGDLIVGKIVMGQGPISLVPVDVKIAHIHGNPIDTKTVHIHRIPVNIESIHVQGNMQTEVYILQRSDNPIMLPRLL